MAHLQLVSIVVRAYDPAVWMPVYQRELHGQKLVDFVNTSRFFGQRDVVVPDAVAATSSRDSIPVGVVLGAAATSS